MITGTIILGTIIWLYALSVLHRAHLDAIHFWVGSVGLFIILAFACRAYFVWLLSTLVTEVTGWWGHLTGIYTSSYLQSNYHHIEQNTPKDCMDPEETAVTSVIKNRCDQR